MNCIRCGKALSQTDIGLHRKLVNRGDAQCMCIACLSKHFGVSETRLQEKAEEFRRAGCTLFADASR